MLRMNAALFLLFIIVLYLLLMTIFALLFYAAPDNDIDGCHSSRCNFKEAWILSVQTFSTVGYGVLAAVGIYSNFMVAAETFAGLVFGAIVCGVIFARVSRPSVRFAFASSAVVFEDHHGDSWLCLRGMNEQARSHLVDVTFTVNALVDGAHDASGKGTNNTRRLVELALDNSRRPLVIGPTTLLHKLAGGCLKGLTADNVQTKFHYIFVMMGGTDEIYMQTVYKKHLYYPKDIRFGQYSPAATRTRHHSSTYLDPSQLALQASRLGITLLDASGPKPGIYFCAALQLHVTERPARSNLVVLPPRSHFVTMLQDTSVGPTVHVNAAKLNETVPFDASSSQFYSYT